MSYYCPQRRNQPQSWYRTMAGAYKCTYCGGTQVPQAQERAQEPPQEPPGPPPVSGAAGPPRRPREGTQAAVALSYLEQGPLCSFTFYQKPGLTHRLAAAIHTLRKAGWDIESRPCQQHKHDAPAVEYVL